jgi:hypothetical protein
MPLSIPVKFTIPWGASAGGSYIRAIPTPSQQGIQAGAASLTDGFPPVTFIATGAGGTAPFGQDMNGILNQITQWTQWYTAGGPIAWDAAYGASIGGYPINATVASATTPGRTWFSTVAGNTTNPDLGGAGWTNLQAVGGSLSGTLPNPTIAASGVAAGTYVAPNLTVASDGRVTAASNGLTTPPQGRITLQSNVPVMTTSNPGAATVYYAPYHGLYVPIYNGSSFVMTSTGGQLSQATNDATKSPSAVGASQNYDVFVWVDTGNVVRATRGPAWSVGGGSATARGTGAGSTALQAIGGINTNQYAITNGPAANQGTYVGTIASNASSTIDFIFGSKNTGGSQTAYHMVWNMYNRVNVSTNVSENAASWTYSGSTFRASNGTTANSIHFLLGMAEDSCDFSFGQLVQAPSGQTPVAASGFELDSSTNYPDFSARVTLGSLDDTSNQAVGTYNNLLGVHYVQAMEGGDPIAITFYGNSSEPGTVQLYTLIGKFRM